MEEFQKDMANQFFKIKAMGDKDVSILANKAINKIESNETISKKKKKETREATGASSAGPYAAPLFSNFSSEETTSKIGGKVPEVREDQKGFKVPKLTMFSDESKEYKIKEEILKGGASDNKTLLDIAKKHSYNDSTDSTSKEKIKKMYEKLKSQLNKGIKIEMEHTNNKNKAKEIAMDHLFEMPDYYDKIEKIESNESKSARKQFMKDLLDDPDYIEFKKNRMFSDDETKQKIALGTPHAAVNDPFVDKKRYQRFDKNIRESTEMVGGETKEATGAGNSGSYSQPSMWAKSTNKKDWAAARKTQIPGGKFVTVKKKCTKFPYCNQGDIKALKMWENKTVKKIISNVCYKTGLNETTVKAIIQYELEIAGKII